MIPIRWVESRFAAGASAHLCVTESMRRDLTLTDGGWLGLDPSRVRTLYDRAPERFRPLRERERRDFLLRMRAEHSEDFFGDPGVGLLVSSTSWTDDEDIGMLFDALAEYEEELLMREETEEGGKNRCVRAGDIKFLIHTSCYERNRCYSPRSSNLVTSDYVAFSSKNDETTKLREKVA